jgi:lactate racemase
VIKHVKETGHLTEEELAAFIEEAFRNEAIDGKRLLFIIPDSTRSMPMPEMFRALHQSLHGRVAMMDYLIALGTHPPMPEPAILKMLGITADTRRDLYGNVGIYNHEWQNPGALTSLGHISEDDIAELSQGMMREEPEVTINRRILDYDLLVVVGPVFPHEVVGFSGGNKYFFPGISGAGILHLFHWLGALITNPVINGTKYTPVRAVVDKAAALIPVETRAFCLNVVNKKCRGIFYGTPEAAWDAAADVAMDTHIMYKDRPFSNVLALCPEMYDDIWVAGKCMYKLEPVVADGGELIIYAPHVNEISVTHGDLIRRIGYHTRDYFLAQMDKFADVPGGILAHSSHVRGIGTYEDGVEKCRVQVTLATAIPKQDCEAINLGYRDPATINIDAWRGREDDGCLLVENAGEILYRLKSGNPTPKQPAKITYSSR